MKKKHILLPVLSTLLLSPLVLAQQVQAEEVAPATRVEATAPTSTTEASSTTADTAVASETVAAPAEEATVEAVILHTNDVHGRIVEGKGVIGDAKAAAVIEAETSQGLPTIVVDAGDAFQGLPISNSTKGQDRANIMNEIGYDAMAVGNHEFDFGLDQAIAYKETLNFPLLSANTYVDGARLFEASTVIDKTPAVVGDEFVVIGVTTPETATKTHPKNVEGVTFAEPISEVNLVIDEVEARAAAENKLYKNYIILAHLGVDTTTPEAWRGDTLAKALSENAKLAGKRVIVIDGHSHTVASTTYGTNVTYSQTGSYYNNIGRITLKSNQLLAEAGLITADDVATVTPDEKVAALVADIQAKYEAENAQVVIENNPVELNGDRSNVRVRETNLGNLVTDALYDYGQTGFSNKSNLAVTNGGGLRATIAQDKPVTKGDIIAVLPFGNSISQITVTGQQIKEMFEKSVSAPHQVNKETGETVVDAAGLPLLEASGGFLHVSGAQVYYDVNKEAGNRVLSISIWNTDTETYDELDLAATYYLATNDFLAAGGDGYTMLGGAREEGPSMDSVFADYLKKVADVNLLSEYGEVNPASRLLSVSETKDTDGDTYPDFIEQIVGTDPTLASSYPNAVVTEEEEGQQSAAPVSQTTTLSSAPTAKGDEKTVSVAKTVAKSDVIKPAASATLPKTGSQSGSILGLIGLGLAGLALSVRKREEK